MIPADSIMVTGYQVGEFVCTWSVGLSVDQSHVYPGSTGCKDYSLWDQAVVDFEHGLDSIITGSLKISELDESEAMASSVSSGFIHLVSTLSDNLELKTSNLINDGSRLGHYFCLYHVQAKYQHLN